MEEGKRETSYGRTDEIGSSFELSRLDTERCNLI